MVSAGQKVNYDGRVWVVGAIRGTNKDMACIHDGKKGGWEKLVPIARLSPTNDDIRQMRKRATDDIKTWAKEEVAAAKCGGHIQMPVFVSYMNKIGVPPMVTTKVMDSHDPRNLPMTWMRLTNLAVNQLVRNKLLEMEEAVRSEINKLTL